MRALIQAFAGIALGSVALWWSASLGAQDASAPDASAPDASAPIARAGVNAAPTSSASAPAIAPAAAPPAESRSPVVRYDMDVVLDAVAHRVTGKATVSWRNSSSVAQRELYLHLYLNAFKNERSVFMRSSAGRGFRGEGKAETWGWMKVERLYARELKRDLWPDADKHTVDDDEDETDIRVPLPEAVEPGETLTLEIDWTSQLPNVLFRTGFDDSFHMVAQWFPKLARLEPDGSWAHFPFYRLSEFYADYGSYDVRIDAPSEYVVGATGKRLERKVEGERTVHRYQADKVHDFAFTAWDQFRELSEQGPAGVSMRVLYPPEYDDAARIELDAAKKGLLHFNEHYGAYPYETLTIVHPPVDAAEAGGMEYPTMITTGGRWYSPKIGFRFLELVTVHELGHQWFYGLVGSNENLWPFLDEGLTQWIQTDAMEAWYPGESAVSALGVRLSVPAVMRASAARAASHAPIAQPAHDFATGGDYGALVYARTATLLETLARVYGRERVRAALGRYARANRFAHPTPEQLLKAVSREVGQPAAANMRAALFERAEIDYEIASVRSHENTAAKGVFGDPEEPSSASEGSAGRYRGTVLLRRHGELSFPVEVELHDANGNVTRVLWDGKARHHELPYEGEAALVAAVVDPDLNVLLDSDLSNNVRSVRRARLAPRVLNRAAMLSQLLMGVLSP